MNKDIIEFSQEQFVEDTGFYYSPAFKAGKGQLKGDVDMYITVEATLAGTGVVSIQTSIDKVNWYDSKDTEFDCTPNGLQQYKDAQPSLHYRLKGNLQFLSAKILV